MAGANFISQLKDFDKDNVSPAIVKKIKTKYISQEGFNADAMSKVSKVRTLARTFSRGIWALFSECFHHENILTPTQSSVSRSRLDACVGSLIIKSVSRKQRGLRSNSLLLPSFFLDYHVTSVNEGQPTVSRSIM